MRFCFCLDPGRGGFATKIAAPAVSPAAIGALAAVAAPSALAPPGASAAALAALAVPASVAAAARIMATWLSMNRSRAWDQS